MKSQNEIVKTVKNMLLHANAHITFNDSVKGLSIHDCAKTPDNLPYNIWQLVEHIRLTQLDILNFCRNKDYVEPTWPDDYWPEKKAPENAAELKHSISSVDHDLHEFIKLIEAPDADLFAPIPKGTGQHLFREAILIMDHTGYHTAEIVVIRRLLGIWN
ncbi:DinB family protein [Chitinophaga silvatica]|uniref:DinB family protein n=1 Tax=Chitinophaga silvatica TaxID=2282649 RepID=A0A3E1YGH0_9BACT|nr:DinB family protein [Chitinophaga silvatica]RFS26513.1 DinB family protein [Chitinophaga silvatica]